MVRVYLEDIARYRVSVRRKDVGVVVRNVRQSDYVVKSAAALGIAVKEHCLFTGQVSAARGFSKKTDSLC